MNEKLKRESNRPYYLQLKEILKNRIQSGAIKSKRLPTVRKVAEDFGVSINTVLRAYAELEKEGVVIGAVGRGTFITTTPQDLKRQNRETLLMKIIEHAIEEALSLEFSIKDFEDAVHKYIEEKVEMMQRVKLCFIECNIEQANYFTNHLELASYIQKIPILLEDLSNKNKDVIQKIIESDIIVTSFHHLDEVYEQLEHLGKQIIGINLEPEIPTLIEVAKIPPESTIGLVTTSEQFRIIVREILKSLNLQFLRVLETNSGNEESVRNLVRECDAVLVSPRQKKIVERYVNEGTKVIEFVFTPDRTSIRNLKVAVLELKKASY
ncbi:MAG: hypothetical protein DRP87_00310 [Spirochaetes bacterium]|nr:MAG: hypothetical protein DRP87_00310 [Spirochaetota bacterium]